MKRVIVTTSWDDGHKLDFKLAELMKKYNLTGTFYISPEDREIPKEYRLTDEEIIKLSDGFEIGAHTQTHPRLSTISDAEAEKEIVDSKKYLEKVLGKTVNSFCYPGGDHNTNHQKIVEKAGFIFARNVSKFSFGENCNHFSFPTTVHAYRHWSDVVNIYKFSGSIWNFFRNYLNWDELAISLFDKTYESGGIYHLWGHSWEIDNNQDWERLERVFSHISNKQGVEYLTNSELVK
jgi:peptidoglycan/xylan/chitin deacetylase (PgdA/CDA1 family)